MGDQRRSEICLEVESTHRFAEIAAAYQVPETEIHRFQQDIARRCRTER